MLLFMGLSDLKNMFVCMTQIEFQAFEPFGKDFLFWLTYTNVYTYTEKISQKGGKLWDKKGVKKTVRSKLYTIQEVL